MLEKLRDVVWNEDIPHPTTVEYKEHHESIKKILKFIDEELAKKCVVISKAVYERLCKVDDFMGALSAAGVDNWEGYGIAKDILKSGA